MALKKIVILAYYLKVIFTVDGKRKLSLNEQMHDFSAWIRTVSDLVNFKRVRIHTGKLINFLTMTYTILIAVSKVFLKIYLVL